MARRPGAIRKLLSRIGKPFTTFGTSALTAKLVRWLEHIRQSAMRHNRSVPPCPVIPVLYYPDPGVARLG